MNRRQRTKNTSVRASRAVASPKSTKKPVSTLTTISTRSASQSTSLPTSSTFSRGMVTSRVTKTSSNVATRKSLTTSTRSYHPNVIDHYENPRNVGSFSAKDDDVGTGLVGAPACGDVMKLQVKVNNGVVEDVKFRTFGCGSAIASSSYATEWLKGKTVEEALTIKNTDIAHHLALPPVKMHCSMLAEDAVKAALQDYQKKQQNKVNTDIHPTSAAGQSASTNAAAASLQQQMQQSGSPHTASADI